MLAVLVVWRWRNYSGTKSVGYADATGARPVSCSRTCASGGATPCEVTGASYDTGAEPVSTGISVYIGVAAVFMEEVAALALAPFVAADGAYVRVAADSRYAAGTYAEAYRAAALSSAYDTGCAVVCAAASGGAAAPYAVADTGELSPTL